MYYKGNNIGLNYDAATGTWSFENTPNDFIDTEAFSSQDPKFDYVPPESTTPDEPDEDPCPAGYIYDSTLKQCVLDPNYQNPFANANQSGGGQDTTPQRIAGTDRTTTDGNFIATDDEYDKMTASELIENYKQRRFIKKNDKGELVIDFNRVKRKGGVLDAIFGRIGQPQVEGMASLNKVIDYLVDKNILTKNQIYGTTAAGQTQFNNEVVIPTIAKFEADYYGIPYSDVIAPGFGDSIFGTKESVQKFDDYMSKKLEAFSTVANNVVNTMPSTMYQNYSASAGDSGEAADKFSDLANIERRKKEAEAKAAEIKAQQEEKKLEELVAQGSGTSEEADKAIDRDKDKDPPNVIATHTTPSGIKVKLKKKPKKPSGGNTLGSSVHGTGSYNPSNYSGSSSAQPSGPAGSGMTYSQFKKR
jgi:hypothetical protein